MCVCEGDNIYVHQKDDVSALQVHLEVTGQQLALLAKKLLAKELLTEELLAVELLAEELLAKKLLTKDILTAVIPRFKSP